MFSKLEKEELRAMSLVLDAMITLLEDREVITKNDIRIQILKNDEEAERNKDEQD